MLPVSSNKSWLNSKIRLAGYRFRPPDTAIALVRVKARGTGMFMIPDEKATHIKIIEGILKAP
ncbi:MAG: hypothetical protein E7J63_22475 [Pantoea sp.]|uniref:hypothetical protein n=1 Tax=Pantoea TaxID=53335 RepID=UPI00065F810E|nr:MULTISPECIES: hypothetical protein [Pantoea]MDU7841027.1 hypothetical protein [Pantoea sp.]